jgi:hypothetical protein
MEVSRQVSTSAGAKSRKTAGPDERTILSRYVAPYHEADKRGPQRRAIVDDCLNALGKKGYHGWNHKAVRKALSARDPEDVQALFPPAVLQIRDLAPAETEPSSEAEGLGTMDFFGNDDPEDWFSSDDDDWVYDEY